MKYYIAQDSKGNYILSNEVVYPSDISLPSPSVISMYSVLESTEGKHWILWKDIIVIDVTSLFDVNLLSNVATSFLNHLPESQYPLVMYINGVYIIRNMIYVDTDQYDKFLVSYMLNMRRTIPKHTILVSERYHGIHRLSQDKEVIDITGKIPPHFIDNIVDRVSDKLGPYTFVHKNKVVYGALPAVTMDDPYDVYIYQSNLCWILSHKYVKGSEKVTTTNGYIKIGFASSREFLLDAIHDNK